MAGYSDFSSKFEVETTLIRGGLVRSNFGETAEAIFMSSGFTYDSAEQAEARFSGDDPGFVYSRYRNPTLSMFEERLRLLEGAGACHGAASGMAAVNAALLCCLSAGDHLVASRALFGSCFYLVTNLLPRLGIKTSLVDGGDLAAWQAAMRPNTRAVFLETPANPTLAVIDLPGVAAIAHAHGARVIVDNVFATPLLQKPLQLGADIVVYSATKHIDGQGRCLGGAVLADAAWCEGQLQPFLRHTGPALSPFNAWLLLKGLETLPLRLERSCASALTIARYLENHSAVARVYYPHLASHPHHELARRQMSAGGSLIAFVMKDGQKAAFALMNALRIIDISNNLGDTKSLITHPMTTTHRAMPQEDRQAMGIGDGLVRLSVGLENAADLIADLDRAMAAAEGARQ